MEKERTLLDMYQDEMGKSKPTANQETIGRFNELLNA